MLSPEALEINAFLLVKICAGTGAACGSTGCCPFSNDAESSAITKLAQQTARFPILAILDRRILLLLRFSIRAACSIARSSSLCRRQGKRTRVRLPIGETAAWHAFAT